MSWIAGWLEEPTLAVAFAASLFAGVATGVGALPALALRQTSERTESSLMGFSAGVMLAASFFSLLAPAMEALEVAHGSALAGGWRAVAALVGGAVVLSALNRWAPHEHFVKGHEGAEVGSSLRKMWLFVVAITLHNVPEGLAVGVGVGSGVAGVGLPVTIGISLQNMPEGLVVALALLREGYTVRRALWVALLTGLVEPISSVAGFAAVSVSADVLPYGLAFSAGAMIYVISDEIIPESHRSEDAEAATWGTIVGFAVMTLLDVGFA